MNIHLSNFGWRMCVVKKHCHFRSIIRVFTQQILVFFYSYNKHMIVINVTALKEGSVMDKMWRKGKGTLCCVNNGLKIFWTASRKVTPTSNLWQYSLDNNAFCWKALISPSEDFSILLYLVKIALGQFFLTRASVFLSVQNYWFKAFPVSHRHITKKFNAITEELEKVPDWLTTGTTYLLPKSGDSKEVRNY